MSGPVIDRDRRDQAVARVAALLGDPTGRCRHCRRLVRLATGGLVPDHHQFGAVGGQLCPGGRQPADGAPSAPATAPPTARPGPTRTRTGSAPTSTPRSAS